MTFQRMYKCTRARPTVARIWPQSVWLRVLLAVSETTDRQRNSKPDIYCPFHGCCHAPTHTHGPTVIIIHNARAERSEDICGRRFTGDMSVIWMDLCMLLARPSTPGETVRHVLYALHPASL